MRAVIAEDSVLLREGLTRLLTEAGIDVAELHDMATILEVVESEELGFFPPGKGWDAAERGITKLDGPLPINPSGGLKAKGHPIGATGVSMHALASMQLTGKADAMQIEDAVLAGIFNMGGAAVANFVSILEPLR